MVNNRYSIFYKAATKEIAAVLGAEAPPPPEGFVKISECLHDFTPDNLGAVESHVMYHHVRDALYSQGITDMHNQKISIIVPPPEPPE